MKDIRIQSTLDVLNYNRKQTTRYLLFHFFVPVLFLLISTNNNPEINLGFMLVNLSNLKSSLFLIFYLGILFYGGYLSRSTIIAIKIIQHEMVDLKSSNVEEHWLSIINVNGAFRAVLNTFNNKYYSSYIFTLPFFIIYFGIALIFIFYCLFDIFNSALDNTSISLWGMFILNIWLLAALVAYGIESFKIRKKSNLNA